MNAFWKRSLSAILAFVMIIGMVPANALQVFAATTSDPVWDESATNPYIIHVAYGEADDITKQQLYDLIDAKWDCKYSTTHTYGGFKYGDTILRDTALAISGGNDSAGLIAGNTYTFYRASEITYGILNIATGQSWDQIGTFKVVEAEEVKTVTVTNTSVVVDFNLGKGTANQWSNFRTAIINAVGDIKVNGTTVTEDIIVKFHNKRDAAVENLWQGVDEYLVLNASNASKYDGTTDKATFTIGYGTAAPATITVSLNDSRSNPPSYNAAAVSKDGTAGIQSAAATAAAELSLGAEDFTVPSDWQTQMATLETGATKTFAVTATYGGGETYKAGTVTVNVTVTKSATLPAQVTITENDNDGGSVVIKNNAGVEIGEGIYEAENSLTITVTPNSGNGYAYFVASIVVSDKDGNTVASATNTNSLSFDVENSESETKTYTVTVTYGKNTLTDVGNTLELNGYVAEGEGALGSDDYSARLTNIKAKVLNAVLGGYTNIDHYTVYIWMNPGLGQPENYYATTSGWVTGYADRIPVPAYGATGELKVKIVYDDNTSDNKPAVTLTDVNVTTKESREEPTISVSSTVSGSFDTKEQFLEAVTGTINVTYKDSANQVQTIDKTDCGLDVVLTAVEGTTNQYNVKAKATKDGVNWLESTDYVNLGIVTWNISVYEITFVNDDGSELYKWNFEYGSTPEYKGTDTATLAAAKNDAQYTYTFAGWNPEIDTVTGVATYTATYTRTVNKYTVSWDTDGDGDVDTTTDEVEYGTVPTAPSTSKDADNTYTYTPNGWDKEIVAVTGNVTYTAQFTPVYIDYTVKFVNWDGSEISTKTYHYGDTIEVPADPTRAATAQYTYTFADWDKAVSATCNGNVTYQATYSATVNQYTVTWFANGAAFATQTADYGTQIVLPEGTPADYQAEVTMTFDKWDVPAPLPTITGNVTYYAVFKQADSVAKIVDAEGNETFYSMFEAALAAAEDGETVILLEDIERNSRLVFSTYIADGKSVTVDGDGHKIYASSTNWGTGNGKHLINVNVDNITLKDVVLDCNSTAEGVNIYMAQNIVFDNVTISNHKGWNSLTVNGSTLTVKTQLTASSVDVDLGDGVTTDLGIVAEDGAVLNVNTLQIDSAAYPNTNLDGALAADGTPYFAIKVLDVDGDLAGYRKGTEIGSLTLSNGYTYVLLKSFTHSGNITLGSQSVPAKSATIDMNGNTLTMASGKIVTVYGALTVTGEGSIAGDVVLYHENAAVTGSDKLPVSVPAALVDAGYKVVYSDGAHRFGTTVTWINGDETSTTEDYVYGATPVAPTPSKVNTAQYTYAFVGWDMGVDGVFDGVADTLVAVEAPVTYKAIFTSSVNSYTVTFVDTDGTTVLYEQILDYGETPVYAGEALVKEYYSYSWDPAVSAVTGTAIYKLVWTPNNDANSNGVADELETAEITVNVTGNGTVTLTAATGATLTKNADGTYTLLFNSLDAATKVVTVTAAPTDTTANDGTVDYIISNPGTVTVEDGANSIDVAFGTHTLNVNNGTVAINGYYEGRQNSNVFNTLKADVLTAAGLTGVNASDYTVKVQLRGNWYDLDKMTGIVNILNYEAFFLAVEVPESGRQWTITDNTTGVSKTVTINIEDTRSSAGLNDLNVTDVKVLDDEAGLKDYIESFLTNTTLNPNGLTVSYKLTEGTWPPSAAGVTTTLVYTVTYANDANYIGDTATLTVNVQSAYNNCTVVADSTLTAGGSLTVSPSNDNTTVAGNDTITVTVKPSGNNVVETITVYKNGVVLAAFATTDISYSKKAASVSFKSDGSTQEDVYTVAATYSTAYLKLKGDQYIIYSLGNDDLTGDQLKQLVFNTVFDSSSAPVTWQNASVKFAYAGIGGINLWGDVNAAMSFWGTHNFGELGSETIRVTYKDEKYGELQADVNLIVYDSTYNNTIKVETITNGANAEIKNQITGTADPLSKNYLGSVWYKENSSITVTLTPDGQILDTLKQMYNGTYSDAMAYIKSVTVYNKAGNVVKATLTRDQGKLSLEGILQGVNPALYNAAVTFTMAHDEEYTIVAEYGILELDRLGDSFQMEMYKGGKDYAAKVPSAQELINTILGEEYAASFLATYGGSFNVEFTNALLQNKWTAVSDEALLALNDGAEIKVRITWTPNENNKTYYPLATTSNVTLVDLRTPTSVAGSVPSTAVEYVEQDQLITELKEAMGLGIVANGSAINVDYTVTFTVNGNETDGYFADVTVSYDGAAAYKPVSKTFENVSIADIPDNATIKVAIQNASDVITNNDGKIQSLDALTGIYTVIGEGTYTFKFTPVSGKAIQSVTVNGVEVTLTYNNQVASFSMHLNEKTHYEVVVTTVNSVWELEDTREYDFAYGVTTPNNADIVDAAVAAPTDIDYSKVVLEYLARESGSVTVALPDIDLGFTIIELGTFDIELGELWLDPNAAVAEYDMEKLLDELVAEVIDKVSHGQLAATDALGYIQNKLAGLTIGAHAFGSAGDGAVETIRISYEDDKYLLKQTVTDVTINDYRIATKLDAVNGEVTYGYSLAQLIAATGAQVKDVDGNVISGLTIKTKDLYLHANTTAQQITLYFEGDENYQPCEITVNVIVNKAPCSIDYDSQFITYGDKYEFGLSVSPTVMPDGTNPQIDRVEFIIGLDMHTLLDVDIEDKDVGLNQAIAYIQLRLPQSIRELPMVGEYLQGEFTLNEFTDLVNSLSDVIGIDEASMATLNKVIEAISGITNNMEIKVVIKDEDFHPTNIGVYIAGAVTVDADFETAYTADYLIIAPKTIKAELDWDYTDPNKIYTLPAYQEFFADKMGAHVIENVEAGMTGNTLDTANGHIKYLIFAINGDDSEFLTTDVYGNIKANIYVDPADITENGTYIQIAYMLNWGNEIYYAMPIIRSFIIVPQIYEVQLEGLYGEPNNDRHMWFDGTSQGFNVEVKDMAGNIVVDTYAGINSQWLTVYYVGVQTNGQTYNSTEPPVHAGIYTAIAVYVEYDENGNLLAAGMDAGIMVIEPADSTIEVEDKVVVVDPENSHNPADQVTAGSVVEGITPDTTIITGGITTDGSYSENGWEAINGTVNIDFPVWVDKLMAQYAPSIMDGITVGEFIEKLNAKLPEIQAALAELGVTEEVYNSFNNAMNTILGMLEKIPVEVILSFQDDVTYTNVGVYLIVGVVTDSDHYPSIDTGVLVIRPDVTEVELKWNYTDENNIWTHALLDLVDIYASAYDKETGALDETATGKIVYKFIGIDVNGNPVIYDSAAQLNNGAYIQIAYIELELDGQMYISDMIARPIIIAANTADVVFIDKNGNENNDQIFTFNNDGQSMDIQISVNGQVITPAEGELTIRYVGVQTNGQPYDSTEPPVNAGIYTVIATFTRYDENGVLQSFGAAVGVMAIEPTDATIDVTGGNVKYDGEGHTATVVPGSTVTGMKPDHILISGGAYVSGDIDSVGLDALHGNVNIDFPAWFDAYLAEYAFAAEGVDAAYLMDFITAYRDDLIAMIPVEALVALGVSEDELNGYIDVLNAYIDALLDVLEQLPEDVNLTFKDNVTYTEPGYYFYYGIVADSDHYPVADTGLLVIEKLDMNFDLEDTTVTWNGEGQMVDVTNPVGADFITAIIDRENNTINFLLDQDADYVITALAEILGVEFDGDVQLSTIVDNYSGKEIADAIVELIGKLEQMDLSEDVLKGLVAIKNELQTLPENATITINGALPSEVGEYEVYALSYSQYYNTVTSESVLKIVPKRVTITLEDATVHIGTAPELGYTVDGLINGDVLEVFVSFNGDYNVAGEYVITATYTENKNYIVTVVDATLTVEGHVSGEVVVENEVAADCVNDGSYDRVTYCTVCDAELSRETVVVTAPGHKYEPTVTNPDCVNGGYTIYTCSVCGDSYVADHTNPLGHTEGDPVEKQLDVDGDGMYDGLYKVVYCSVCDEELSRKLIVDYICWNMQTGVYYTDLSDALEAAIGTNATIQMLADATTANSKDEHVIIVYANLTLDLNGYYIQTDNMIAYGVVVDTYDGNSTVDDGDLVSGGIIIAYDTAKAITRLQPANSGYLPIYDTVTNSYKFFKHETKNYKAVGSGNSVSFWFYIEFENAEGYKILGRTTNSGLTLTTNLSWTGVSGVDISYDVADSAMSDYGKNGGFANGYGMYVKLSGLDALGAGAKITESLVLVSITGVTSVSSDELTYIYAG